jgi:hypothetical protein
VNVVPVKGLEEAAAGRTTTTGYHAAENSRVVCIRFFVYSLWVIVCVQHCVNMRKTLIVNME